MSFYESHRRQLSITTDCRKTLVIFTKMPRDLPLRQSSGCMDGDISVVVTHASRRPPTSMRLVKVGNTIVALETPAFQFSPGLSWFRPRSSGALSTILGKSLDTWLSPHKGPRPHNKPTHVDFIHSAFNNKRHSSSCQSKFVKKTTFNNSLSLDLTKSGLETSVFFLRQILRTPRFCLRTKSLRSLCKISSSKSQKTPAGLCPSYPHRGRMIAFATAVQSVPSALRGPLD